MLKQLCEVLLVGSLQPGRVRAAVWRETARVMLVLMSLQRRAAVSAPLADPIVQTLHTHAALLRPRELVRALLLVAVGPSAISEAAAAASASGSVLSGWPLLGRWFGQHTRTSSPFDSLPTLAEQLLLVLTSRPHPQLPANPFRDALSHLVDSGAHRELKR